MGTEWQLLRTLQSTVVSSPGEQYVPRGGKKVAGSRDRHQLRDPQGIEVQSGDSHVSPMAR